MRLHRHSFYSFLCVVVFFKFYNRSLEISPPQGLGRREVRSQVSEEVKAAIQGGAGDGEVLWVEKCHQSVPCLIPTVQSASGKMAAAGHTRGNCRGGGSQEAAV